MTRGFDRDFVVELAFSMMTFDKVTARVLPSTSPQPHATLIVLCFGAACWHILYVFIF